MKTKLPLIACLLTAASLVSIHAQTAGRKNAPHNRPAPQTPAASDSDPAAASAAQSPPAAWTLADLPPVVQAPIRRSVGDGIILGIERISLRGAGEFDENGFYRIEYMNSQGHYRLQVSSTGDILANNLDTERPIIP